MHFRQWAADSIKIQVVTIGVICIDEQGQEVSCHNACVGDRRDFRRLIGACLYCDLHVAHNFSHFDQFPRNQTPFLNAQCHIVNPSNLRCFPNHIAVCRVDFEGVVVGTHLIGRHVVGNDLAFKSTTRDQVIGQNVPIGIVRTGIVNPSLE